MPTPQYIPQTLPWRHPFELAKMVDEQYWVLLYSGVSNDYSGRYSLLACGLKEKIRSAAFDELAGRLSSDNEKYDNSWFGYLSYGLKNTLENLQGDEPGWLNMPDLCMLNFSSIYQFDHYNKTLVLWSDGQHKLQEIQRAGGHGISTVSAIHSNMTRQEYLKKAAYVIDKIHAGDLYQANLTRKFYGEFEDTPDHFQVFAKLCEISPAPYSAFIRMDDSYIISSSPELFLNISADGNITTRPIKGTAPRGADKISDDNLREQLSASEKDRAENLMIVDLMRNDLARCCVAGSVKTDSLFDVTTHATIHHLSSAISGKKLEDCSTLESVKAIFPPGSMTGAPKISAMNLCSELEKIKRGVYAGAIGWFGGDGSCDLSVVIRTLLIKDKKFEFQVGGGIVADSTPQKELDELISKAKGILLTLGIPVSAIEEI